MTLQTVTLTDGQEACSHEGMHDLSARACACGRIVVEDTGQVIVTGDDFCPHIGLEPAALRECTRQVPYEVQTEVDGETVTETEHTVCGRIVREVDVDD